MANEQGDRERIALLAGRVRWLDRWRRRLSISIAALSTPLVVARMSRFLGTGWPEFHGVLLAIMAAALLWWFTEVALAWLAAVWETECDRLLRDRGIPRAEVLPPRRRRKRSA